MFAQPCSSLIAAARQMAPGNGRRSLNYRQSLLSRNLHGQSCFSGFMAARGTPRPCHRCWKVGRNSQPNPPSSACADRRRSCADRPRPLRRRPCARAQLRQRGRHSRALQPNRGTMTGSRAMRLRMRLAVSVLLAQIGSMIRRTSVVSIAPMGRSRIALQ
jgi:hypothetical protein